MLLVFALQASSFIIKFCPAEKPDAAGNLISNPAEADTPRILSETDDVTVVVTAVLESFPPPGIVTVTLLLGNTNESLRIYVDDSSAVFQTFQDETSGDRGNFIFVMD